MTNPTPDVRDFQARLERLDALIREVERFADPAAQAHTREIVQALLDLHGVGLDRLLEHVAAADEAGAILDTCANDDVVSGLLLLHGLHPLDLEARVHQALDNVQPHLRKHGGSVELLEIRDGVVRLRLEGDCQASPSAAMTVQQTIEQAICGKAPEVIAVELVGLSEGPPMAEDGRRRIALPVL